MQMGDENFCLDRALLFQRGLRCVEESVFCGLILAASGLLSPPLALAAGLAYGFTFEHPYPLDARRLSKLLAAGFGCRARVRHESAAGAACRTQRTGIHGSGHHVCDAAGMGIWASCWRCKGRISFLISTGTAICGGSAIAAIAPVANATEEEIAVSLGTVFALNSVALLVFPAIGTALHMTQTQFGLWSALAIHDTSSVVGASAKFGAVALAVGTTVKLARALWIVPMSVGTALVQKSKAKIQWPWFILFFCLASVANTYVGVFQPAYSVLRHLGILGLTVTLFLIGTGISKKHPSRSGRAAAAAGHLVVGGGCDRIAGADSRRVDFIVNELALQVWREKRCPAVEAAGHFAFLLIAFADHLRSPIM